LIWRRGYYLHSGLVFYFSAANMAGWHTVIRAFDSRLHGRDFSSQPLRSLATTLGKLFTQYTHYVPVNKRYQVARIYLFLRLFVYYATRTTYM